MSGYQKKRLEDIMREPAPGKRVGIIHLQMVREERSLYGMGRISSSWAAVEITHPLMMMSDREMLVVMSLSANMEPLAVEIVAVGGLDGCVMDVRNIFKQTSYVFITTLPGTRHPANMTMWRQRSSARREPCWGSGLWIISSLGWIDFTALKNMGSWIARDMLTLREGGCRGGMSDV